MPTLLHRLERRTFPRKALEASMDGLELLALPKCGLHPGRNVPPTGRRSNTLPDRIDFQSLAPVPLARRLTLLLSALARSQRVLALSVSAVPACSGAPQPHKAAKAPLIQIFRQQMLLFSRKVSHESLPALPSEAQRIGLEVFDRSAQSVKTGHSLPQLTRTTCANYMGPLQCPSALEGLLEVLATATEHVRSRHVRVGVQHEDANTHQHLERVPSPFSYLLTSC